MTTSSIGESTDFGGLKGLLKFPELDAAADSRADHDHQAVAKGANPNHEVRQRQPELQKANGPLIIVISIEED